MSRNVKLKEIRENPHLITRRALSVLCASIVSTDGVLSAPLQLGAKLLLSRAAVLCPGGVESWRKELQSIDSQFTEDVISYIKSIEDYELINPLPRSVMKPGDKLQDVIIFHDGSSLTAGVSIYLGIINENGTGKMEIVKAGSKSDSCSTPVMEHISRSYGIVMLQPLINVLRRVGGLGLNFTFISDSTCSLRLLREEIQSTNKLESNTRIQLENLITLSEQFSEGKVRASWVPSRLNLGDLLTRAPKNPINIVNSKWYRNAITP